MNHCKNCNSNFSKKYCNNCGQKLFTKEDKSLKNLFEELVHFLTHFEGTFIKTLKTLYLNPSKITNDYCNGIRKKYFKPISLYLLVVFIYLLIPIASGLNMKMKDYKGNLFGASFVDYQIKSKAKSLNITVDELATKFEIKSEKTSKFMLFLIIPFSAFIITLLYYNKRKFLYETIMLSTELNIFFISVYFLIFPFIIYLFSLIIPSFKNPDDNLLIVSFFFISFILYIYTLFNKFYLQNKFLTFVKAIVFVFIYGFLLLPLYKLIIFETVMLLL